MKRAQIATIRTGNGQSETPYTTPLDVQGWSDITGQPTPDIETGMLPFTVEAVCTDAQLDAIKADARFAVLGEVDIQEDDTPEEPMVIDTSALSNLYSDDVVAYVDSEADPMTALLECQTRPPWKTGVAVEAGDVFAYGDNLYRCVQPHTTQADWTPDVTPALWVKFYEAGEKPTEWQTWTAYAVGEIVTYEGTTYECRQAHTSQPGWQPPNVPALWLAI